MGEIGDRLRTLGDRYRAAKDGEEKFMSTTTTSYFPDMDAGPETFYVHLNPRKPLVLRA